MAQEGTSLLSLDTKRMRMSLSLRLIERIPMESIDAYHRFCLTVAQATGPASAAMQRKGFCAMLLYLDALNVRRDAVEREARWRRLVRYVAVLATELERTAQAQASTKGRAAKRELKRLVSENADLLEQCASHATAL